MTVQKVSYSVPHCPEMLAGELLFSQYLHSFSLTTVTADNCLWSSHLKKIDIYLCNDQILVNSRHRYIWEFCQIIHEAAVMIHVPFQMSGMTQESVFGWMHPLFRQNTCITVLTKSLLHTPNFKLDFLLSDPITKTCLYNFDPLNSTFI